MSALTIDVDEVRRHARRIADEGDRAFDEAHALAVRLDELAMTGFAARRALDLAATTAWELATFLQLVGDAVVDGDGVGLALRPTVDELTALAAGGVGRVAWWDPMRVLVGPSPLDGDLGGTYRAELRSPFVVTGSTPVDRGRSLVMRAIADAGDGSQIHPDEFELVRLADDRFVVVLPGVTDLSSPDLSWSDRHRSVRDLDQAALESYRSTGIDGNPYARMVIEGLRSADVPRGAELLVVGHSFGADTALDLAADPTVNGVEFRITHVVAAGYASGPQLAHVPPITEVLVLQNRRDVPVIVEAVGQSSPVEAVGSGFDVLGRLVDGDGSGALDALGVSARHWSDAVREAARATAERADDVGALITDVAHRDWNGAGDELLDIVTLTPSVQRVGPNAVVDVFAGGADGAGHHTANYIEHVATTGDPDVSAFLASLDAAGFASSGSSTAIDVSVPMG